MQADTKKLRLLQKEWGRNGEATHPDWGAHVLPLSGRARIRLMSLLHNQGQVQRQSSAFNSEVPCVHAWCLGPDRTSQSPESARPPLKWALRQLALALLSLMARMIQGCRTSDMCERDVFYIFTGIKRDPQNTEHKRNPHHGLFKNISHWHSFRKNMLWDMKLKKIIMKRYFKKLNCWAVLQQLNTSSRWHSWNVNHQTFL